MKIYRWWLGSWTPPARRDCLDPELARTEQETFYALQTGDHLLIGFPLMIRNDLFGVMLVEEDADTRRFRQKRVEIVNSIAQQVALSIQNEHLQRKWSTVNDSNMRSNWPDRSNKHSCRNTCLKLNGWDLAATWHTARQVGGDFYDVFELPGGKLGLFIADVSDKGIPAAIFMAVIRTLVRAVVYDTPSPAETMRRVNALIIPDNKESMFVTAVYGVLSLKSGKFTYANAGHNPPIWADEKNKKLVRLNRTGPALGIIEDLVMEEQTTHPWTRRFSAALYRWPDGSIFS